MGKSQQEIRYRFVPYVFSIVLLTLVLAGCSSGRPSAGHSTTATAAFNATTEPAPPAVEQVLERVAQLRGLSAPDGLRVGLIARSDVPKLLDSLTTDEDRASMATTTTLYRLLGLLAPDQDYLTAYQGYVSQALAGVYSPADKALWVVHDDGVRMDFSHLGTQERQTLEHELVHVVQDAHCDLGAMADQTAGDLDLSLTMTALVEGDAVSTQRDYDAKYASLAGAGGTTLLVDTRRLTASAPAAIQRELQFPYTTGADWVSGIRQTGGNAGVDALFRQLPQGTVFVFHPERIGTGWTPARVSLPDISGALGAGWTRESSGQLGQFELQNYLQLRLPGLDAVEGADGWAGDHYDVYRSSDASAAVVRVQFDTVDDAAEFTTAQVKASDAGGFKTSTRDGLTLRSDSFGRTTIQLGTVDTTVTFVLGSSADTAVKAAGALAAG